MGVPHLISASLRNLYRLDGDMLLRWQIISGSFGMMPLSRSLSVFLLMNSTRIRGEDLREDSSAILRMIPPIL